IAFRFERAGNPVDAFKHFSLANSEKSPTVAVKGTEPSRIDSIDSWREKRNELETTFGIDRVQSCQSQCESELPIFIVSMPRSGTTLTEQIIGRHPNVFAGGERFDISDIAHTLSRRLGTERPYPLCIDQLTPETVNSLAREYLEQTERLSSSVNGDLAGPQRATDKMPTNFWHLGLIACLFPNARIVHVQRNPIDVCLSCFKQNLTWPFCSLTEIVDYFDHYARLMKFWKRTLPLNIYTVRYEELVRAPDATARELIQFCGLEWDHACLDPASADNSVQTPSKWQVRQPIYQSSVNSWRRYEKQLAPLVSRLMDRGLISRDFAY
ncbi:MAG: sulfotransferase family protein, partial [Rhodopirellula sp. JB044]|uniref:sulfotransferase family protein n=1 Tax=Rhodopirellula sp. JB044 TaxID=3342844 RepID=UPI00370B4386